MTLRATMTSTLLSAKKANSAWPLLMLSLSMRHAGVLGGRRRWAWRWCRSAHQPTSTGAQKLMPTPTRLQNSVGRQAMNAPPMIRRGTPEAM